MLIDWTPLLHLCQGRASLALRIVQSACAEFECYLATLDAALDLADAEDISVLDVLRDVTHAIKGAAYNIYMQDLGDLAAEAEQRARDLRQAYQNQILNRNERSLEQGRAFYDAARTRLDLIRAHINAVPTEQ